MAKKIGPFDGLQGPAALDSLYRLRWPLLLSARFPLERNRSNDKKSRNINMLERILVAKVCQTLRNSL